MAPDRGVGKQAEICNQYLTKGKQIYVEGTLQTRSWEDRDGNKRYTTEVKGLRVLMLGKPDRARSSEEPAPPKDPDFSDDDIPF